MVFDDDDPRTALTPSAADGTTFTGVPRAVEMMHLNRCDPTVAWNSGAKAWAFRGQNMVVNYATVDHDDSLDVHTDDEYFVLVLTESTNLEITHEATTPVANGQAGVVVPAGTSRLEVNETTGPDRATIVTVFATDPGHRHPHAINDTSYLELDPNVAPTAGTENVVAVGPGVRVHPMNSVEDSTSRFGRIFRTDKLMVNWLATYVGPRDPDKLSPHVHDDFEQCCLTYEGDFVHHARTPWTTRLADWRPDEHIDCSSPSAIVIPPGIVHTTRSVGPGDNNLIDIFAPARQDFISQGWVLNSQDYAENPN
jgi:hypothetical protein